LQNIVPRPNGVAVGIQRTCPGQEHEAATWWSLMGRR
jgi:hypothetical protein